MARRWAIDHPVAAGTLASLIAAGLWALGTWLFAASLWTETVPVWALGVVCIAAIGIGTWSYVRLKRGTRRIAIAVSAFSRKQFFADLLERTLLMAGLQRWDSVVKMPAADYSAPHQDRDFLELIRERKSYVGAIVVPIEPAARQGVLRRFANEFGRP
ncbi:MAG: hypothetical protein ACKO58_02095, partial [Cyanobium sp.]